MNCEFSVLFQEMFFSTTKRSKCVYNVKFKFIFGVWWIMFSQMVNDTAIWVRLECWFDFKSWVVWWKIQIAVYVSQCDRFVHARINKCVHMIFMFQIFKTNICPRSLIPPSMHTGRIIQNWNFKLLKVK